MCPVKSWQRVAGIVLLIVSGVVIQQSVWVLRLLDHGQPGSGFMPFGLGVILAVLASSIILTTVTDVVGFFSFLGIATLLASRLA